MRIVRHGKYNKKQGTRFRCADCGCVFELKNNEVKEKAELVGTL